MGKRSIKGKEKKLQRKAENEKVIEEKKEIGQILARASEVKDLLEEYSAFQHYRRNDLDLDLRYYFSRDLPQNVQDWAFSLCKANMEAIYNTSWGWSDTDKRQELTAPEARFLVAYDKGSSEPMAYVHFRWEEEEGIPILYCYEIQLEAAVQRKGLGRFLMKFLELMGRKAGVHEVMLTVMKANTAAAAMYAKLGYEEHEDQPESKEGEEPPSYIILTKRFPAAVAAASQRALRPVTNAYQLENIICG